MHVRRRVFPFLVAIIGLIADRTLLLASEPPDSSEPPVAVSEAVPAASPVSVADSPTNSEAVVVPPEAEPSTNADPDLDEAITKERINEQIKLVTDATTMPEAVRAECLQRLNKVLECMQAEEEALKKIAEYQAAIQQSGPTLDLTKAKLAEPSPQPVAPPPHDTELSQLEQQLTRYEVTLKDAQNELVKREEELKQRGQRKTHLASIASDASKRLAETQVQLKVPATDGEEPLLTASRRAELSTRASMLEQQLVMYRVEGEKHDAMAESLPLLRDLAAKNVAIQKEALKVWQQIVAERRKAEANKQAREARRRVEQSHPSLRKLAERNLELADLRTDLAKKLETAGASLKSAEDQAKMLMQHLESAEERVAKAGHTVTVGIMLQKLREKLPSQMEHDRLAAYVRLEMPLANLQRLELEEERGELGHFDGAVAKVVGELGDSLHEMQPEYVQNLVQELLNTRRDLLTQLIRDYDSHIENLSKLEVAEQDGQRRCRKLANFIDEHVLWIRSTEPLGFAHALAIAKAGKDIASVDRWRNLGVGWWSTVRRQPTVVITILVLAVLLVVARGQIRRQLKAKCRVATNRTQTSFLPTLQSAGYTLLMGLHWPSVVYGLGWLLSQWEHVGELGMAIGDGLRHLAFLFWIIELVWQLCRPQGLAENHFGWTTSVLNSVRRNLQWFRLVSLPTLFVSSFASYYREGILSDSLGRVTFILLWGSVGVLIHRLIKPKSAINREFERRNDKGWLYRLWNSIYLLALLLPALLIGLAVVGFHFSAQELAVRFELSLALILGVIVVQAMVLRWVLIKRRVIALREAREAQSQSQEVAASGSIALTNTPIARRDLRAIHEQIRMLLGHVTTIGLVVGLWLTWANVLPALHKLDRWEIWSTTIESKELVKNADGTVTSDIVYREQATTLRHALIAVAMLLGAFAAGKNLPALLEFTVLDRLPIDGNARHASAFLLRYTISIAAIVLTCRSLQITWASVQWLAAAMTVGLGFGLQEIFANLVSGLIILFERPVRIGDIVTVGSVTGTVTAMKMRATTITDFDRRELIVPNKKFITEDVMNWTLSDPISRVVMPVGIAYGSDTMLAHSILLKVAHDHPLVLEDPEPTAIFSNFGDSTLNFNLRVFIPSRDVYPIVVHDINTAIDRAFRDAKIEIAFPQRDINIRSMQVAIPGLTKTESESVKPVLAKSTESREAA